MFEINTNSVMGTYESLVSIEEMVLSRDNANALSDYYYWKGYLSALVDFDNTSEDIPHYNPDLWDKLKDFAEAINEFIEN